MQEKNERVVPECWLSWTYFQDGLLCTPLRTLDGRRLVIRERGELNEGNGPDVLGALLEIDGVCYRGDVEFHVDARDWYRHGHDDDRRYRAVLLHLVWDGDSVPSVLQGRFAHVALSSQLLYGVDEWRRMMQRLEVEAPEVGGRSLDLGLPELASYAGRRFDRKVHRLATWCDQFGLEDATYIALAVVFGYSQNTFPFRQLLWESPPSGMLARMAPLERSPLLFWSYWCWRAGLLDGLPGEVAEPAVAEHCERFRRRGEYPHLSLEDWNFGRLRPANSPYLRLAALAQLLFNWQQPGLFERFLAIASTRRPLAEVLPQWLACLQQPIDISLARAAGALGGQIPQRTLGRERARQVILNALLPLLSVWAMRSRNPGLQTYLASLYEQFPRTESSALAERLAQRFSDSGVQGRIRESGFYQQGALEAAARSLHLPMVKEKAFDSASLWL